MTAPKTTTEKNEKPVVDNGFQDVQNRLCGRRGSPELFSQAVNGIRQFWIKRHHQAEDQDAGEDGSRFYHQD